MTAQVVISVSFSCENSVNHCGQADLNIGEFRQPRSAPFYVWLRAVGVEEMKNRTFNRTRLMKVLVQA